MSGRWDITPDQYDVPVIGKPTRIVVSGEVEVAPWPPFPEMSVWDDAWEPDPPKPSLWERVRAALGRWTW
jgi:hypothetical protein